MFYGLSLVELFTGWVLLEGVVEACPIESLGVGVVQGVRSGGKKHLPRCVVGGHAVVRGDRVIEVCLILILKVC